MLQAGPALCRCSPSLAAGLRFLRVFPMSAPLALSVAYQAYPAGVVAAHGYHDYYWPSPEEEDREEEEEEMEPVQSSKGLLAEEAFSSLEDKPSHRKAGRACAWNLLGFRGISLARLPCPIRPAC